MDKLDESSEQINKMFGPKQSGQGQQQPQPGGSPGDGESEDGDGSGGSEEGESDGEGSGDKPTDDDGFQKVGSQKEGLKKMMDPRGETNKNWGENDVLDADVQNMVNERKGSSKMWGKFTADFMNDIVAANTPKISWKEILRRFNTSVVTTNTIGTRKKANRRFDLDAPGKRRVYTTKIIFAVDVSGSMSDDDLAEGFAVINSVCRHADIEYVLFDTEIKLVEKKMKKAKDKFKIKGRGGTDFEMMCRYADKNKADGMIIYSDGYAPAPNPPKNCKVLWLLTGKDNKPPVDWGFAAHLSRDS
jgi:predicted metal-dependent peptidase